MLSLHWVVKPRELAKMLSVRAALFGINDAGAGIIEVDIALQESFKYINEVDEFKEEAFRHSKLALERSKIDLNYSGDYQRLLGKSLSQ